MKGQKRKSYSRCFQSTLRKTLVGTAEVEVETRTRQHWAAAVTVQRAVASSSGRSLSTQCYPWGKPWWPWWMVGAMPCCRQRQEDAPRHSERFENAEQELRMLHWSHRAFWPEGNVGLCRVADCFIAKQYCQNFRSRKPQTAWSWV